MQGYIPDYIYYECNERREREREWDGEREKESGRGAKPIAVGFLACARTFDSWMIVALGNWISHWTWTKRRCGGRGRKGNGGVKEAKIACGNAISGSVANAFDKWFIERLQLVVAHEANSVTPPTAPPVQHLRLPPPPRTASPLTSPCNDELPLGNLRLAKCISISVQCRSCCSSCCCCCCYRSWCSCYFYDAAAEWCVHTPAHTPAHTHTHTWRACLLWCIISKSLPGNVTCEWI